VNLINEREEQFEENDERRIFKRESMLDAKCKSNITATKKTPDLIDVHLELDSKEREESDPAFAKQSDESTCARLTD
jgi:hypothetical protein